MDTSFLRSARHVCRGLLALALPLAAHAQSAKIFVASYGNDSNVGNSVLPKRNFQAAHDAVASGGEIVVLDTAGYGALSITKSVSLVVPAGVNGFITVSGNASGIDINAAATDVVSLQGLIIEGGGSGGGTGIFAPMVGTLRLQDCTVRNFGLGIVAIADNINSHVLISGCNVRGTPYGLIFNSHHNGFLDAIVTACSVDDIIEDGFGLYASSDQTNTHVAVSESTFTDGGVGSIAIDVNIGATLLADHNTITGYDKGISNSATALSFGNNTFADNGTNGIFSGTATRK